MSEGQWAAVDALTAVPGGWFGALLCLRLWPRCGCTHSCLVLLHAGFAHLAKDMEKNSDKWNTWCSSEGRDHSALPGDWARLSEFKQLLLLRALRPDRVATALQQFCESVMGARYVNQEAFSPQAVLAESSRYAPLRPADMLTLCRLLLVHAGRLTYLSVCTLQPSLDTVLLLCVAAIAPLPSSSSSSLATHRPRTLRSTHASWARPWRQATSHSSPWGRGRKALQRLSWTGVCDRRSCALCCQVCIYQSAGARLL